MRIEKPAKTICAKEAYERLGQMRSWFYNFGINQFVSYYHEHGKRREYILSDVDRFGYWLMVREGLIALGHWGKKSQVLPQGDGMKAKRLYFEDWLKKDPHGATCPQCDGPAVQRDGTGPVWCKVCGISEKHQAESRKATSQR